MSVPMPPVVVLFLCKVIIVGPPDQNAGWTGHQNLNWATEHSMMICRRQEIELMDLDEAKGADPQPFNEHRCWRAGFTIGTQWDVGHPNSSYRFWRVACPVPVKNSGPDGIEGTPDDEIIAWKRPECPHRDVVHCEIDSAI